jgi:mono/diheme cytochrome c family protein
MRTNLLRASVICSGLVALSAVVVLSAQSVPTTTAPGVPRLVIQSVDGRDLYNFYCATCHGRTGRGDGPVAPALRTRPSDLSILAKRNGGIYPATEVGALLSGPRRSTLPAHGSDEMPVWGPIFRALDSNDTQAAIRVANLVMYVESIQVK